MSGRLPGREWQLRISRTGFVEARSGEGAIVEFGSFEDAGRKVEALEKALRDDPELLENVSKLVLTSPANPVRVP
jgi:hypothetical protein